MLIDAQHAINIARKFLEQYNDGVVFKNLEFDNEKWIITFAVGFSGELRHIGLDAISGKILNLDNLK